jgi:hypothetical protein
LACLRHFTKENSIDEIEAAIQADGACIVDALVSADFCDQLMRDFKPTIESVDWCNTEVADDFAGLEDEQFFGVKTKRFHGLASLSPNVELIISDPFLLKLACQVLGVGNRCRDIRVSNMELMVLGEGETRQSFHRDFDSWPYLARSTDEIALISANIALTDFTETNGATVVVPGSHQWPKRRAPKDTEICQAVMSKGSALLYSGDVVHGGGSNLEAANRTGFYIGYIPSWLSNLENHAVSNTPEIISGLDERTRRLLDIVPGGWIVVP